MTDDGDGGGTGEAATISNLSFQNVQPVSIKCRDLSISLRSRGLDNKLFTFFSKKTESAPQSDLEAAQSSTRNKKLLDLISFDIPAGNIFAIVGGSGSGKTTLLNTLAQRSSVNNSKLAQTGEIHYNNTKNIKSVNHAYVIQQDILIPTLTCYETLKYAANLRLSSTVTDEDQEILIDQIINELGLKDARDTMVGNKEHKGLSGGEKRRLSIGIQMLSNPSLLFLDEPTTGLDAHSAYLLIKTLKNLAAQGRTFVLSVHQPRSDIFFLFDYLCILSKGSAVYCDKTAKVVDYFGKLGYTVPENVNPADYLVDITSIDTRSAKREQQTLQNFELFRLKWRGYERITLIEQEEDKELRLAKTEVPAKVVSSDEGTIKSANQTEQLNLGKSRANLWREVIILTRREWVLTSRDPLTTLALMTEAIFLGCILGWIYYKPDKTLIGIRSLNGCLYNINALQGYLMLLFETYRLCNHDIKIFDRERAENSVTVLGFLIARRVSKFFTEDIIIPTIFCIITYFMVDMRKSADAFFIYWSINLFTQQLAMGFSLLCIAITRDYPLASLLGNFNFTFQTYCCGFFVNLKTMPVYVKWLKYLCYVWYSFGITVCNQYYEFFGNCPYSDDPSDPRCVSYTGRNIIETLGFSYRWIKVPECACLVFLAVFYSLAAFLLWARKVDIAVAKQSGKKIVTKDEDKEKNDDEEDDKIDSDVEKTVDKEKLITDGSAEGIDIFLRNIDLNVKVIDISIKAFVLRLFKLGFWNRKERPKNEPKHILNSINAHFQKNKVNAIMGPSGSGKTTLLNLISGKLTSNFVTEYTHSGAIYFNNYLVERNLLSGICSYVLQDDENLLPSLTVRETLMFAAKLRLPKFSSKQGIETKVNNIILKLGLKDCQNNMVGNEFVKGISGGEKRRVSIGIQLLNDPQVIFLDEPTSGLDSFTASSILTILENLAAKEQRTVILTIHQPRYSIFRRFGQILLLAKGGNVVFNGSPLEMSTYFEKLSYYCPPLTNFADYVLDLVSVNTQTPGLEELTKQRAAQLVDNWNEYADLPQNGNESNNNQLEDNAKAAERVFGKYKKIPASFSVAFWLILQRQGITVYRHKDILFTRIFQTSGTGIINALFYAPIKRNYIGITNMLGLVQQVSSVYFVGMLNNVAIYPTERNFFYEEYRDHVYGVSSFFFAYTLLEVPFEFVAACIYGVFTVFAIGLPRTANVYFSFVYVTFLLVNCGESLGIMFNTAFHHTGFAINIISVFLCVAVLMSGLLSLEMPSFFRGINWISPVYYSVMSAVNVLFDNELHFSCSSDSGSAGGGGCLFNNGQEVLQGYKIKKNYKLLMGLLAVVTVAYRAIAYAVLYWKLNNLKLEFSRKVLSVFDR